MEGDIEEKSHILALPDCLMMILLSYLDSTSLYQMSRTNLYFKNIISDQSLWKYIDARKNPNTTEKVTYCVDRIHEKTTIALFRAQSKKIGSIPQEFLHNIAKFDNIKILALENQFIDGRYVKYSHFPKNLEELSLRESYIKMNRNFFKGSCERFTKLRVLILDGCHWTDCGFLMSIAKYENLEIISLVGCKSLDSDSIAYFGLARFGYQKLKIFDCRFTGYAQSILKSFVNNQSILGYYFQHDRSYKTDYGDYLMELPRDDLRKRGAAGLGSRHPCMQMCYSCSEVDDHTFIQFINVVGVPTVNTVPDSVLYKDPYGPCTCGYREKGIVDNDVAVHEEAAQEQPEDTSRCKRAKIELPNFLTPSGYDDDSSDDEGTWVPLVSMRLGADDERPSGSRKRKGTRFRKVNHIRTHIVIDLSNHNNNVASIPEDIPTFPNMLGSSSESSQSENDDNNDVDDDSGAPAAKKRKKHYDVSVGCDLNAITTASSSSQTNETNGTEATAGGSSTNGNSDCNATAGSSGTSNMTSSSHMEANQQEADTDAYDGTNNVSSSTHMEVNPQEADTDTYDEDDDPEFDDEREPTPEEAAAAVLKGSRVDIMPPLPLPQGARPLNNPGNERPVAEQVLRRLMNIERLNDPFRVQIINMENIQDDRREGINHNENEVEDHRIVINLGPLVDPRQDIYLQHLHAEPVPEKKIPLKRLSLRGYSKITDKILSCIKDLNLDLLDLTYTQCTVEGINNFLVYNPNCRIIHKDFCVCKPKLPF